MASRKRARSTSPLTLRADAVDWLCTPRARQLARRLGIGFGRDEAIPFLDASAAHARGVDCDTRPLLTLAFSYLRPYEWVRARRVCKAWLRTVDSSDALWRPVYRKLVAFSTLRAKLVNGPWVFECWDMFAAVMCSDVQRATLLAYLELCKVVAARHERVPMDDFAKCAEVALHYPFTVCSQLYEKGDARALRGGRVLADMLVHREALLRDPLAPFPGAAICRRLYTGLFIRMVYGEQREAVLGFAWTRNVLMEAQLWAPVCALDITVKAPFY
jgi:hypothetical protein